MSVLVQKEFPSNKKQEKYFFFSSPETMGSAGLSSLTLKDL